LSIGKKTGKLWVFKRPELFIRSKICKFESQPSAPKLTSISMIERQRKKKTFLGFREAGKLHPYETILYFSMIASGSLFVAMLVAFAAQRFDGSNSLLDITMPKMFVVSTVLLLVSSFTVVQARHYMHSDNLRKSVLYLGITFALGALFFVAQIFGWIEFYRSGFGVPTANVASLYIYVLSAIHLFHLVIAFALMTVVLVPAYRRSQDRVAELIHITNPYEKKKVDILAIFWHYIDAVWLVLFFYFLLTS